MEPKEIRFYNEDSANGWYSNFSHHPVIIEGVTYPTNEHYYQAQKFVSTAPSVAKAIMAAETPGKAKRMGASRRGLDPQWEEKKVAVMKIAVLAKFTQHEKLKRRLLETGDAVLIESTKKDHFWGCGADGTGHNHLGKILMEVRKELAPQLTEDDYEYWAQQDYK